MAVCDSNGGDKQITKLSFTVRDAKESDAEHILDLHTRSIRALSSSPRASGFLGTVGGVGGGQEEGKGRYFYTPAETQRWAARQEARKYVPFIQSTRDDFIVAEALPTRVESDQPTRTTLLGFAHLKDEERDSEVEVMGLYVLPSAQRKGVGRALFGELQRRAQMRCGTNASSRTWRVSATLNAVPFYESVGFTAVQDGSHCAGGQTLRCMLMERRDPMPGPLS